MKDKFQNDTDIVNWKDKIRTTNNKKISSVNKSAEDRLKDAGKTITKRDKTVLYKQAGWPTKMSPDDWSEVIERIAAGQFLNAIAKDFAIHPSTIYEKKRRDKTFADLLNQAREDAALTIFEETRQVARGVKDKSSGDIRRDELIVKTDTEYAKKIASRILGDKLQIDQRSINISINDDDIDW